MPIKGAGPVIGIDSGVDDWDEAALYMVGTFEEARARAEEARKGQDAA